MPFNTHFALPNIHQLNHTETVYLFQYSTWGHHSLGFYRNGQLIEFTYGDWDMFALNKRDIFTGITHMLWPTLGALGCKKVDWKPGIPLVEHFTDCIDIVPFKVSPDLAESLYLQLTQAFDSTCDRQVYLEEDDLYFVPYKVSYALWNNCNHELAKWLEALGGRVSGNVFCNPDFIKGMKPRLSSIL
jgi:hypothetical protein